MVSAMDILRPYISPRIAYLIGKDVVRAEGALLLTDISGFTKMSEELARMGKPGTEELIKILNNYFRRLLSIIKDYGGEVLKFGGDALLIGFYGPPRESKILSGTCAVELMQKMSFKPISTLGSEFEIAMKIIVQTGFWFETIIGDSFRRTIFLSGKTIKVLLAQENFASASDIFINGEKVKGIESIEKKRKVKIKHGHKFDTSLLTFLPQGVFDFIKSGMHGEHRAVSIIFVNYFGYDEENLELDSLQRFFRAVSVIVNKYHGSINKTDISETGSKLAITFGAPIMHGNEVLNSVLAAIDLRELEIPPIKLKIGVHSGYAYAGIVGSDYAKEYSLIGDAVNTSARLMSKADVGTAVVSENTRRLTKNTIEYLELTPVKVKGKRFRLKRFIPLRRRAERIYQPGFIGRRKERSEIEAVIKNGKGLITVKGVSGIGKSRLLFEIINKFESECKVLKAQTHEVKGAFNSFTNLIANEAGIDFSDTSEVKRIKLRSHLEKIDTDKGELLRRLPIIGAILFDLSYPNSIFEHMTPQLRFENLADAIRYYIEYQAKNKTVVIFDDVHWMREQDLELLNYIIRVLLTLSDSKNNIVLLLAGRSKPDIISKLKLPNVIETLQIELAPLDEKNSGLFANHLLNNKPLPDDVSKLLNDRAAGNPFYIEQFLLNLIDKKLIEEKEKTWIKSPLYREDEFPENIWSAIMARVDRLEMMTKKCLRVGSIVGLEFSEKIIQKVLNSEVREWLLLTQEEGLTYKRIMKEIEYIFKHALIKDVIYDSILRRRRRQLHCSIGETIEDINKDNLRGYYGILAYHFNQSEDWKKALDYNIKAGDKVKEEYRNEDAEKTQ